MEEQKNNRPSRAELEDYARKLAQLTVRIQGMTPQEREHYAKKVQEVNERLKKLPDWLRGVYEAELKVLTGPQPAASRPEPAAAPVQTEQPAQPARREEVPADSDSEDEYEESAQEDAGERTQASGKRSGKKKRGCLIVVLAVFVIALVAGCFAAVWGLNDITGNRGHNTETKTIEIEQGANLRTIGETLQENGIIRSSQLFRLYAKVKGEGATLQYGTFEVSTGMSYDQLIEELQTMQKRDTVRVTFPEGIPAVQFAQRMEEAGLCTADEFLDVANNGDFSQFKFWSLRDENPNQFMACEGYLFPDTYEFYADDDVYNMVAKIYGEFDSRFTDEMYQAVEQMGFTLSQFMTLASIVQEEAGLPEHQADVAAVFMNRLKEGSPVPLLQSNCSSYIQNDDDNNYINNTIAPYYGGWDKIPAEIVTAYDTYTTPGLPAGPISNPGMDAITNTMNYASSQYYGDYFFVTDLAGTYYYAKTDAEHEQNKSAAAQVNASLQ